MPAGPKERLDSTVVSQPAIYVASLAAVEQLRQAEGEVRRVCVCQVACLSLSAGQDTDRLLCSHAWAAVCPCQQALSDGRRV